MNSKPTGASGEYEIAEFTCSDCGKQFFAKFIWFLTKPNRCDNCCVNQPRNYSKPPDCEE